MVARRPGAPLTAVLLGAAALSGCGGGGGTDLSEGPVLGKKGEEETASVQLGFPGFATKNTTRVGGADATADAAGVALAVFSGRAQRPRAVALVDRDDWHGGIAAAVFMSPAIRAPVLLTDGADMPEATESALAALDPTGARAASRAEIIRVGDAARPEDRKVVEVQGANPYALAQEIDQLQSAAAGKTSDEVIIASGERREYAIPAAGLAAKSGDPVLYVTRDRIPRETASALRAHQQPKIYVLGPPAVISERVLTQLRRLGTVRRISGRDPVTNAIEFARYTDGSFGWGVRDAGHGLIFVNPNRPMDAVAASPLSAAGTYAPILLVDRNGTLPKPLVEYLYDIRPGYNTDPVRGVYNHGWLLGDSNAIPVSTQAQIDQLLEIVEARTSVRGTGD